MAIAPARELKIGKIVDETLGVLERCAVPAAIYVLVIAVLNAAATRFGLDYQSLGYQLALGLVAFTISVVGAYLLFEAILRRTGHLSPGTDDAFLAYIGLSILYTLGVGLGFILLIIPGLIVMARWSVAQPLLLTRGSGVMTALRESWDRTRGNEFAIIVAALLLLVVPIAITIFAAVMFEDRDLVGIGLSQLASAAMGAISISMGVALFGLIVAGDASAFE